MQPVFDDDLARVAQLVARRAPIIECIEARLLNARGKQVANARDRRRVAAVLSTCFGETSALERLAGAHVQAGFEIVPVEHAHHFDALELVTQAYDYWERHRWPGRNGRIAVAHVVYAAHIIRQLEYLSLQIWNDENDRAPERLGTLQRMLDALNAAVQSPVTVRDARWLLQTAQGPLTRYPAPYFKVAEQIESSLTASDRLEIHVAGVKLAGGHLRSQLRHRGMEQEGADDEPRVLVATRNSNSMDLALLVQDLVPLLEAYDGAHGAETRVYLADGIVQGLSADPELLITHSDLLGPYTVIEGVLVSRAADGVWRHTAAGRRHQALLGRYREKLAGVIGQLKEDVPLVAPDTHGYSPLGLLYGFCADLFTRFAMTTLTPHPAPRVWLEELFETAAKSREREALEAAQLTYSPEWAERIFRRTIRALEAHTNTVPRGRILIVPEGRRDVHLAEGVARAQEHYITSDFQYALATGATAFPKSQILLDRREGRYLASTETAGRWFCVSKAVLTLSTARGEDAVIVDVPEDVVDQLRLTCGGLVEVL